VSFPHKHKPARGQDLLAGFGVGFHGPGSARSTDGASGYIL
jgi:hypothetical protein